MTEGHCSRCGLPVEKRDAIYRVEGWEKQRVGGGANSITQRKRTGEVAHMVCVVHKTHHPDQLKIA